MEDESHTKNIRLMNLKNRKICLLKHDQRNANLDSHDTSAVCI